MAAAGRASGPTRAAPGITLIIIDKFQESLFLSFVPVQTEYGILDVLNYDFLRKADDIFCSEIQQY